MYHTKLKTKEGYGCMVNIKNIVISGKISEDECERAKTAMNSLFEKGELSRNTISCLVREALNKLVDETLEGKKDRTDEELEEMKGKLRTMENEIRELKADNERLKDEKTSLERKLKNSEKSIGELAYTDLALQNAYQKLMKENQYLKGYQLSPEVKEGIDMYKEVEKCECLKIVIRRLMNK